jgi:hypothetical protein
MAEIAAPVFKKLYKATLPSINYIFKNGKPAIFVRGKFATDIAAEVEELDNEIALGHPHIFIDPNEAEQAPGDTDLLAGLRLKLEAEIRAEMAAASLISNDRGTAAPTILKPASTVDIAAAAAGSGPVQIIAGPTTRK